MKYIPESVADKTTYCYLILLCTFIYEKLMILDAGNMCMCVCMHVCSSRSKGRQSLYN